MKTKLLVLALWSFVLNFVQSQNPGLPEGRTSSFSLKHPQLNTLSLGPHAVGFQVFNQFDYGRHFQPKLDFEGKKNAGESALPIQISMWYPAQTNKLKKILFAEYRYLDAQKNTFKPLTEQEKKEAGNGLKFTAKFGADLDYPAGMLKLELQQKALPPVPTPEEFEAIVMSGDLEKATRNFVAGKQLNPYLQLFDFQTLNLFSFRFGQQQKKEQVLAIWKLGAIAFPNSVEVLGRLGDAYAAMGEKLQAREQFEKALNIVNHDLQLDTDAKKRLQSSFNEKLGKLN